MAPVNPAMRSAGKVRRLTFGSQEAKGSKRPGQPAAFRLLMRPILACLYSIKRARSIMGMAKSAATQESLATFGR